MHLYHILCNVNLSPLFLPVFDGIHPPIYVSCYTKVHSFRMHPGLLLENSHKVGDRHHVTVMPYKRCRTNHMSLGQNWGNTTRHEENMDTDINIFQGYDYITSRSDYLNFNIQSPHSWNNGLPWSEHCLTMKTQIWQIATR